MNVTLSGDIVVIFPDSIPDFVVAVPTVVVPGGGIHTSVNPFILDDFLQNVSFPERNIAEVNGEPQILYDVTPLRFRAKGHTDWFDFTDGDIAVSGPLISRDCNPQCYQARLTFVPRKGYDGSVEYRVRMRGTNATGQFFLKVVHVNLPPVFDVLQPLIVLEDQANVSIAGFISNLLAGNQSTDQRTQNVSFTLEVVFGSTADAFSSFDISSLHITDPAQAGTLSLTLNPDKNGNITFQIVATDDGGTDSVGSRNQSDPLNFTIQVLPVNDAPTFEVITLDPILEDSGLQNISVANNITSGPDDESTQELSFNVVQIFKLPVNSTFISTNAVFEPTPQALDIKLICFNNYESCYVESEAALLFDAGMDQNGVFEFALTLQDSGGTERGGDNDTVKNFTLTIIPVNDAPTFDLTQPNVTVLEDPGWQVIDIATNISRGAANGNENFQNVSFKVAFVTPSDSALFDYLVILDNGTMMFQTSADANGLVILNVTLEDDGGVENGGVNVSLVHVLPILLVPVNDPPSFEINASVEVLEDEYSSTAFEEVFASLVSPGAYNELTQNITFVITMIEERVGGSNPGSLFANGSFPRLVQNGSVAVLAFRTESDAFGSATLAVALIDDQARNNRSQVLVFNLTILP
eukprot:2912316-Rhodomonas_salina.1